MSERFKIFSYSLDFWLFCFVVFFAVCFQKLDNKEKDQMLTPPPVCYRAHMADIISVGRSEPVMPKGYLGWCSSGTTLQTTTCAIGNLVLTPRGSGFIIR